MTDPDSSRVWSSSGTYQWNVASMIAYYQWRDGGVNGMGNTGQNTVKLCIGNGQWEVAGSWAGIHSSLNFNR